MKKLILIGSFFIISPLVIFASILDLSYLNFQKSRDNLSQNKSKVAYAALPSTQNLLKDQINFKDIRIELVANFFQKYNPELIPFAQKVVDSADKYDLDFRLVPAIAMQESNLCKKAPKDTFNCWGFGIYGKNVKKFKSYSNAIDAVTKTLASDYRQQGLITPEQIMKKYTPQSRGSWAKGVSHFMNQLNID